MHRNKMDKQYSVKFFSCFIDSVQRLCREYLDFEQAVELSGYLSLEIDNSKKERFVLSELVQNSGDVMSESYCTKAYKTIRKDIPNTHGKVDYKERENIAPISKVYQDEHLNVDYEYGSHNQYNNKLHSQRNTTRQVNSSSFIRKKQASNLSSQSDVSSGQTSKSHRSPYKRLSSMENATPSMEEKRHKVNESLNVIDCTINESPPAGGVSVKQENDIPYMVIDHPDLDMNDDTLLNTSAEKGSSISLDSDTSSLGSLQRFAASQESQYQEKPAMQTSSATFSGLQRIKNAHRGPSLGRMPNSMLNRFRWKTPQDSFTCRKCGYFSKWKSNLTRHMRLKHNEVKDDQIMAYPYGQVLYPQSEYREEIPHTLCDPSESTTSIQCENTDVPPDELQRTERETTHDPECLFIKQE